MARRHPAVLVIGLDGLEPSIVEEMLAAGELPALAGLRARGGYARVATTYPAETPVAWSTFATGTNPGGHGIYDFLRRNPANYLPDLSLNRYEQRNAFTPPRAVNLRGGETFWDRAGRSGIPATIIRCPCTYPAEIRKGHLLSGLGVPDIRGGLGTPTLWTEADEAAGESERMIAVRVDESPVRLQLPGPRLPQGAEASIELEAEIDREGGTASILGPGFRLSLTARQWSEWARIKFRLGTLQSLPGIVRFFLVSTRPFRLYASPVNFAPDAPPYPISAPRTYAGELQSALGPFSTAGMAEDHTGLLNGRIDETAFLAQCSLVMREREAMLQYELARFREGILFCLFDTPDRIQHMFWRFGDLDHPANALGFDPQYAVVIRQHYRDCDAVVGRAVAALPDEALVIVLSDHGFTSFQRGVHLNGWLRANGFLTLKPGVEPGEEAGEFFQQVDWGRTEAYALGFGGIYLNRRGREAGGILDEDGATRVSRDIVAGLTGLLDVERGARAVERVLRADQIYQGPCTADAPDLLALTRRGYRASWTTALGGVPATMFEDNTRRWGGDHIVDPELAPGVLFMSRPFREERASLLDLAPTILSHLGPAPGPAMEGQSLLASSED